MEAFSLLQRKSKFQINPSGWVAIGFAVLILIGSILLALPISSETGEAISLVDAFFIATSSVCVTGLSVLDIESNFSLFGELIIIFLVQIGGLGFMTFGVFIAILLGKKVSLKSQILIKETTKSISSKGLIKLTLSIIIIAFSLEAVATVLLTWHWSDMLGMKKALYYALFHSISAFNNAGFSLWPQSLTQFVGDSIVNFTIASLFLIGGIGFTVLVNLYQERKWRTLSLHSKIVLVTSGILISSAFLFILIIEWFNPYTLGSLDYSERFLAAFFHGVVPRSAGFNTLDISQLFVPTQFFMIFLMFIGASSGSTGGGIKVNTFAVLIMTIWSIIRGEKDVQLFYRRIPMENILLAMAVFAASMGIVIFITLVLTITERGIYHHFFEVLFEVTSAFSTAGLSMGLTAKLSTLGKIILTITMYIGRLGPLTLAFALAQKSFSSKIRYPEEKVLIG